MWPPHGFCLSDQQARDPAAGGFARRDAAAPALVRTSCASGLALAGPTRGVRAAADDGILTAAEAAQL